jgi:UPF0755 protein
MKGRKLLIITIIIFSMLLTTFGFYAYQSVYSPNILVNKESKYLLIPTGATFSTVQDSLYAGDYVQNIVSFSFLSKLMKYDELVRPGKYRLESNMSNREAITLLRSGKQTPVRITFNNIRTIEELSERITMNLEIKSDDLLELIQNPEVREKYGFDEYTIKCMFIPNTYEVYWNVKASDLVTRMKREYDRFWNQDRLQKAADLRMTPVEVMILASIVEAESNKMDEAPVIAGLYINRLKKGMPLQADPTLVYATGDFSIRRVLNKHKEIDSPYNTYKYTGLPPGPIRFPHIRIIDATLNHEKHDYIFMVAKEDFSGYHHFTNRLSEHMKYARRYQQALNAARLFN